MDDDDDGGDDRGIADGAPVAVPTASPPPCPSRETSATVAVKSTSSGGGGDAYPLLTQDQIRTFVTEGVLVVPDVLTPSQLSAARRGLRSTLLLHGVDPTNLPGTGHNLSRLSSTGGSGGVLDVFYPGWKMDLSTNEGLFRMTTQLWRAGYCHDGETEGDMLGGEEGDGGDGDGDEQYFRYHPYGPFDCARGYAYVDRIGYRLPTRLSEELGRRRREREEEEERQRQKQDPDETDGIDDNNNNKKKDHNKDKANRAKKWNDAKKKNRRSSKPRPLQRSLTPHLDVCPQTFHDLSQKRKWRPIQCLISLTDTPHPDMGGFEAAVNPGGFHRSFHRWTRTRAPSGTTGGGVEEPPCVGEYTPLRPREDVDVLGRMGHVPVMAGGAIFWDTRVPHGNAYRHDGGGGGGGGGGDMDAGGREEDGYGTPRAVAYCSFLPDVEINRRYVARQLEDWKMRRKPRDGWIEIGGGEGGGDGWSKARDVEDDETGEGEGAYEFSELGRKLMGIDEW